MSNSIPKSKIVCTIGPASSSPEKIKELIAAGMNVARVNFSHGNREEHAKLITNLREQSHLAQQEIAILVDLQGPKIRANTFPNGKIEIRRGEFIKIVVSDAQGSAGVITTKFEPLVADSTVGDRILIDDGLIELNITEKHSNYIICKVINGGFVKDKKGINLPDTKLNIPAMTKKDIEDAMFALELDVDFLALSFVRSAKDIEPLKNMINEARKDIYVIAKIEKPEAIVDLKNIVKVVDAIMVARGDLGVEAGNEKVPSLQKSIIRECLSQGIPVITATQMLESMTYNPRPTRAEASDVANAIFDGTDAVMLSGETAVGEYAVETVKMMRAIILEAEKQECFFNFDDWDILDSSSSKLGMSIAKATRLLADQINAKALCCFSDTGQAAIRLTTQRSTYPVYIMSKNIKAIRRMCLIRGAYGILLTQELVPGGVFQTMEQVLYDKNFIHHGDSVVYTCGLPALAKASTNTIQVRIVE